ncbi:MAG: VCBS repeat-containing protein [Planctomycetaceae bacterium]|nr:VCBS repeat-containing protein [Planctomycetaceae bacterium]
MTDKLRILLLLGALFVLPVLAWRILPAVPMHGQHPELYSGGNSYPPSPIRFERQPLGDPAVGLPSIANVQILDFNGDGQKEMLVCDVTRNRITLISRTDTGEFRERTLIPDVSVPAHVTAVDLDGDGDLDLAVSVLGNILPDDGVIGRLEIYEQTDDGFRKHVVLEDVRRVADAQPGDFDGDGDIDLAVAVFGYARGQILWLENRGNFEFVEHELLSAPGTIHVPVADYNGDGYPDIAAIVTQDEEELWCFENLAGKGFRPRRVWRTPNLDLGSAGLVAADLDSDGDIDLILPTGDNLEDAEAYPQPYHGCWWFENQGNWEFEPHRISNLGGTYAAEVADFDGDGDQDVVLVSMTNDWYDPRHASIIWLENDGQQNFTPWQIDNQPIHLVAVAVGDLNGNGRPDIVAGALNLRKPFERIGRLSLWWNQPPQP